MLRQIANQDNVGDAEVTAGFEDAVCLLEDAVFVGHQVQDAVGDDDISYVSRDGHFFYVALAKFDVVKA